MGITGEKSGEEMPRVLFTTVCTFETFRSVKKQTIFPLGPLAQPELSLHPDRNNFPVPKESDLRFSITNRRTINAGNRLIKNECPSPTHLQPLTPITVVRKGL